MQIKVLTGMSGDNNLIFCHYSDGPWQFNIHVVVFVASVHIYMLKVFLLVDAYIFGV